MIYKIKLNAAFGDIVFMQLA